MDIESYVPRAMTVVRRSRGWAGFFLHVALMRARLSESISLEEMARVALLSPFHFARHFKAATGHPPHDCHIRLRVDRAQELLRTRGREWTLAAIATECGFVDQSHLSRHFKRVVGVTPGEYLS